MKTIEFTTPEGKIAIILERIQAIKEGHGDRKGKANIIMTRLSEETDDYFPVEESYNLAHKMIIDSQP